MKISRTASDRSEDFIEEFSVFNIHFIVSLFIFKNIYLKIITRKQIKKIYRDKIKIYYKHKKVNKTPNHQLICKYY